jgi:hypothetical protein
MLPETVFKTPYLRYQNPADLQKIQAKIKALGDEAKLLRGPSLEVHDRTQVAARLAPSSQPKRSRFEAAVIATSESLVPSAALALKIAAEVTVTPAGTVLLGFNCRRSFTASAPLSNSVTHAIWNLLMKNQQSGEFERIFFMGGVSALTKVTDAGRIKFDHDFSSYRDAAYASANKTAEFKVEVRPYCLFDELAPGASNPVTLDFSPTSCIGIHSVGVEPGSSKGGANGSSPTLTVTLDAPAGPGGQKVALSVDNSNLGNIMGSGWFVIPQGHTSETLSWFLGTRRVYSTGKSITIKAELVSPGGNSGPGYATVTLTKQ